MSEYEAKIRTRFGELTIHFTDKSDLEKKLSNVKAFEAIIKASVGQTTLEEPEKVIPGFEGIYAVDAGGQIKLLKFPKQKVDTVRLVLFLSSRPLDIAQIRSITGVDNPLAYMGHQHFIHNPDDTYVLSSEGRTDVTVRVVPSLRGTNVEQEEAGSR